MKNYNQSGENNNFFGHKHSDETKKKMSDAKIGTQSDENNNHYGHLHSEESKEKMRKNHVAKPKLLSEEDIEKIIYMKSIEKISYKDIAAQYNISEKTIRNAANGKGAYAKKS